MEEREEELKKLFRDELESVRNSQKTLVTENISKLEKKFQNHQQEFMMIQQMNDANSMQHEEARRQVENFFIFATGQKIKCIKESFQESSRDLLKIHNFRFF